MKFFYKFQKHSNSKFQKEVKIFKKKSPSSFILATLLKYLKRNSKFQRNFKILIKNKKFEKKPKILQKNQNFQKYVKFQRKCQSQTAQNFQKYWKFQAKLKILKNIQNF